MGERFEDRKLIYSRTIAFNFMDRGTALHFYQQQWQQQWQWRRHRQGKTWLTLPGHWQIRLPPEHWQIRLLTRGFTRSLCCPR